MDHSIEPSTTFEASLFDPIQDRNALDAERLVRPCLTYWQDAWIRLRKNKIAMLGICIIVLYVVMSILGPRLVSHDFKGIDENNMDQAPSALRWAGTSGPACGWAPGCPSPSASWRLPSTP
jgi:hypothetical protein